MKISIIGAGMVGATTAFLLATKNFADIVLVDIVESVKGKAMDINHAMPLFESASSVRGTTDISLIKDSDIVVVTAGFPRMPGMDRADLLNKNAGIIRGISTSIKSLAPNSTIIVVTNPLDVMAYLVMKITGFGKSRVMGMAGMLDTARFKSFIAEELDCSPKDIDAVVLGSHGNHMVPLIEKTTVKGKPITEFLSDSELSVIIEKTINAGAEIVKHLKKGSAYFAPASAIAKMVMAIANDSREEMPVSAYLEGEYGINDVFIGVPAVISSRGVEKVEIFELDHDTMEKLKAAAEEVRSNISLLSL